MGKENKKDASPVGGAGKGAADTQPPGKSTVVGDVVPVLGVGPVKAEGKRYEPVISVDGWKSGFLKFGDKREISASCDYIQDNDRAGEVDDVGEQPVTWQLEYSGTMEAKSRSRGRNLPITVKADKVGTLKIGLSVSCDIAGQGPTEKKLDPIELTVPAKDGPVELFQETPAHEDAVAKRKAFKPRLANNAPKVLNIHHGRDFIASAWIENANEAPPGTRFVWTTDKTHLPGGMVVSTLESDQHMVGRFNIKGGADVMEKEEELQLTVQVTDNAFEIVNKESTTIKVRTVDDHSKHSDPLKGAPSDLAKVPERASTAGVEAQRKAWNKRANSFIDQSMAMAGSNWGDFLAATGGRVPVGGWSDGTLKDYAGNFFQDLVGELTGEVIKEGAKKVIGKVIGAGVGTAVAATGVGLLIGAGIAVLSSMLFDQAVEAAGGKPGQKHTDIQPELYKRLFAESAKAAQLRDKQARINDEVVAMIESAGTAEEMNVIEAMLKDAHDQIPAKLPTSHKLCRDLLKDWVRENAGDEDEVAEGVEREGEDGKWDAARDHAFSPDDAKQDGNHEDALHNQLDLFTYQAKRLMAMLGFKDAAGWADRKRAEVKKYWDGSGKSQKEMAREGKRLHGGRVEDEVPRDFEKVLRDRGFTGKLDPETTGFKVACDLYLENGDGSIYLDEMKVSAWEQGKDWESKLPVPTSFVLDPDGD